MAAAELLHSTPDIARKTSEFRHVLPDASLFDTLRSLGHPYGLIFQSHIIAAQTSKNHKPELLQLSSEAASYPSIASSGISKLLSEKNERNWKENLVYPLSCLACIDLSSSGGISTKTVGLFLFALLGGTSQTSFAYIEEGETARNRVANWISREETGPYDKPTIQDFLKITWPPAVSLATYSASWYASFKSEAQDRGLKANAALLVPSLLANFENHREYLEVSKHTLTLGSTSLKLSTYRGQEPFTIKTPDGQPVAEIQPGDPLATLHVSHQASRFRRLPPLEKAHAMVEDVTQLLTAIDHTDPSTLSTDQQTTLAKAKDATIIGISHLVRLFRRQTGLPTWKLDVLPPLLQHLHALDSQAVSTQFGGKRRVRPSDIEMLVITPYQRRQLLANLQT